MTEVGRPGSLDDWRVAEAQAEWIAIIGSTTGSLPLWRISQLPEHVLVAIQERMLRNVLWEPAVCSCCGHESDDDYEEVEGPVVRILEAVVVECLRNEWPIEPDIKGYFDTGTWSGLCRDAGIDLNDVLDRRTA